MPNRRMITSNLFVDNFIGHLNPVERLLWVGMIGTAADDQGRMLDNIVLLRAQIFLFDTDITDAQVEHGLSKLAGAHKITRYRAADGTRLIQIVKWWRHQTPAWASPSIYPAPTEWQDRIKCHVGGNKVIMFEWEGRGGYIAGYTGRYVADNANNYIPKNADSYVAANADDYLPAVGSSINEDDIKDKNESEGDGGGDDEVPGPLGVKAPGRVAPSAPRQPAPPPPPPYVPMGDVVFESPTGRDVVCQLAHWTDIPKIQVDSVDHNLAVLVTRYPKKADLLNYCQRFAEEFYRRYPARTSVGWLDWAVMGNIPPASQNRNRYAARGRSDPAAPVYPPRQKLSEAQIAEGIAILTGK